MTLAFTPAQPTPLVCSPQYFRIPCQCSRAPVPLHHFPSHAQTPVTPSTGNLPLSTHYLHTFDITQAFLMTTSPPSPQKSSPFRNAPDHTPSTSPHHTWPGLSHPRRPQPPTTTPSGRERAVVGVGSGRMGQIYSAFPCCSLTTIGSTFVWGACGLPQALEI